MSQKGEEKKGKQTSKNYIGKILDSSTFNKAKLTAIIQIPLWWGFRSDFKSDPKSSSTKKLHRLKWKNKAETKSESSACSGTARGAALGAVLSHPALGTHGGHRCWTVSPTDEVWEKSGWGSPKRTFSRGSLTEQHQREGVERRESGQHSALAVSGTFRKPLWEPFLWEKVTPEILGLSTDYLQFLHAYLS